MASWLTEYGCEIRQHETKIPRDALSVLGPEAGISCPAALYGLFRSFIRSLSTAATTARYRSVWFDTTSGRFGRELACRRGLLAASAFLLSAIAWSGHAIAITLSLFLLVLLGLAKTRRQAYFIAAAYYAGATWQILPGAGAFFGHHANPLQVVLLWTGVSLLLATPWAALGSANSRSRLWRTPLALLILAAPPLGIIGCASPLTAEGLLFPGLGWSGFALMLIVCALLSSYPRLAIALVFVISFPAQLLYRAPEKPANWQVVSTHFGGVGLDTPNPLAEYAAGQSIQQTALDSKAKVIVFPETVLSNWNPGTDLFWAPTIRTLRSQGKTILVGANVFDPAGQHYFNSVVVRGAEEHSDFRQRIPVPIAMWIPFSERGVPLRLQGTGTIQIGGRKAAVLICYEHLLVWPALTSFREHPDLMLAIANDYWARTTTVPEIQRACLESWARLFRVPLLWAQNN